ncbi:hypothetical protein H6F82_11340 [Coleofasciculus sp. FACHB-SPT9]|uniref:hypothetical protein n=1 Tax=Coleofasciculus sp. FACHB-SPT9 TaxID=2692791 RepID=UPI0019B89DD6|nr:hypothetical protein [Coleofasciculus sp. FACHB-SPT9]
MVSAGMLYLKSFSWLLFAPAAQISPLLYKGQTSALAFNPTNQGLTSSTPTPNNNEKKSGLE